MAVCRKSPRTYLGTPIYVGGVHINNPTVYSSITAGPCEFISNAPGVRYNEISSIWEFSNDGTEWLPLGSGSVGFTPIKVTEYIVSQVDKNTNHTLPNSETFKMAQGEWLDVLFNGQLLTCTLAARDFDYEEVSTSQVKFHFDIPVNAVLTYIIRKRP